MNECMTQEDAMNMSDEQAVQILKPLRDMMIDQNGCPISDAVFALDKAIVALSKKMPTVERREDEWCTDCKEYDQKKHCCPRFNRVIREALDEVDEQKNVKYQQYGLLPVTKSNLLVVWSEDAAMNEGVWIKVTSSLSGRRVAVNLAHVVSVRGNSKDDIYNGRRATIDFSDGTSMEVCETFDEIWEMIR